MVNGLKRTLIAYEDGTCESLESALENRHEEKSNREDSKTSLRIGNVQLTAGIFSYVKEVDQEKHFCYAAVDEITLKPYHSPKSFHLTRPGQDVRLMGSTVIQDKIDNSEPSLITIWSDKRLFKQTLSPSDGSPSIGFLHSIIDPINANKQLSVTAISEDCIAIYACKNGDDGSFVILYNMKYKVVQSKVPFKVYLSNFKLWCIQQNIFLAMGEQLSVIPYRISIDQLSSMVGSQRDSSAPTMVEKEMINEDLLNEENLEFDDDQTPVEGMVFRWSNDQIKYFRTPMSKAKPIASADEVSDQLEEIYREELQVDLVRSDEQSEGEVKEKLLSNVDESFPLLSENFEILCSQLEACGFSEMELTDRVIPVLIKTCRTEDIGLLLKKYSHVSEQMLTKIIKYLLSCLSDDEADDMMEPSTNGEDVELEASQLCKAKKFPKANVFLNTKQKDRRDVLSIALCCSFDSEMIMKFLRNEIVLEETVQLMDHLYSILRTSFLEELYDMRGNIVEGSDFDLDSKLFEWFRLLLDSHYQQILLSHDSALHDKLDLWLHLIDDHIRILKDMNELRPLLAKLSTNKPIQLSKKCNQWYTIEKLTLY